MPFARWALLLLAGSFAAGCSGSARLTPPNSESTPLNTVLLAAIDADAAAPDASCPLPVAACGGDPTGNWQVATSCLAPSAPAAPVEPCAGVSYVSADLQSWTGTPMLNPQLAGSDIHQGSVTFNADHSYDAYLEGSSENSYHFASSCLGVFHAQDCGALASTLQGVLPPSFVGLSCTADDQGCECSYRFVVATGDLGTWQVSGTTLTLNGSEQGVQTADLCTDGASLQIGAAAGGWLFNVNTFNLTGCG
jgi:hypothetical protein